MTIDIADIKKRVIEVLVKKSLDLSADIWFVDYPDNTKLTDLGFFPADFYMIDLGFSREFAVPITRHDFSGKIILESTLGDLTNFIAQKIEKHNLLRKQRGILDAPSFAAPTPPQ